MITWHVFKIYIAINVKISKLKHWSQNHYSYYDGNTKFSWCSCSVHCVPIIKRNGGFHFVYLFKGTLVYLCINSIILPIWLEVLMLEMVAFHLSSLLQLDCMFIDTIMSWRIPINDKLDIFNMFILYFDICDTEAQRSQSSRVWSTCWL